jgi:hypothetical protein
MDPTGKFAKHAALVAAASVVMPTVYGVSASRQMPTPECVCAWAVPPYDAAHVDNELPGLPDYLGARPTVLSTATSTFSATGMSASAGTFDLQRLDEGQGAGLIDDQLRLKIRQARFLVVRFDARQSRRTLGGGLRRRPWHPGDLHLQARRLR